ncbi:hypothetical protein GPJ56_001585 [Histomonas meleagridis]|uniref:uncharacterized protein n=1 Tax=Histomonas meleagridis TaxID=135588 RepID=UPI003559FEF3|nr:hypothetical protein GPJ56_001585 [Histomonas meleagridis]KAH0807091.1 hypothetical protein GO595_000267 [Histomonas meleagridis]
MELLVQTAATECAQQNKSTMSEKHVLTALEKLDFKTLMEKAQEKSKSIEKENSARRLENEERKKNNLTREEQIALMNQLHEDAVQQLRLQKQREAMNREQSD